MSDQARIDQPENLLDSEDETPVRITEDGRVVAVDGPQPPIPFSPTMKLRWMVSPVPGERPTLQQLWRCDDAEAVERGSCRDEEWRSIGFVDYRERSIA